MQFAKIAHLRGPPFVLLLVLFLCWFLPAICHGAGPPPVITVQPLDETVPKGGTALFAVVATSGTTLSYQWSFGSSPISGATASTLTLSSVSSANEGNYSVAVRNAGGTVKSTKAKLTVINILPVANIDAYSTLENVPLTIPASGVLANDVDLNGDPLTAVRVTTVSHGSLSLKADGGFTYTPAPNYTGKDTFTYKPNDGTDFGNVATVTLDIKPADQPPVANNQSVIMANSASTNLVLTATDVDNSNLVYAILGGPTNGTLGPLDSNSGAVTYTPVMGYFGSDSFAFTASSGGLRATGQVSFTITSPPLIITQPSNQAVRLGQSASLSVVANGTSPLTYQWQINGTAIASATNSALTLNNVQATSGGNYTVLVTNIAGLATSQVAILTVYMAPSVSTTYASNVSAESALLNVTVNPQGTSTACWFQYGLTMNYGSSSDVTTLAPGNTFVTVTQPLTGLAPGTIYHYSVVATNAAGMTVGTDATFTTAYNPPLASTLDASSVMADAAVLNFGVNPQGAATTCWLQYGLTLDYGSSSAITALEPGTNFVTVSQLLAGLAPATLYHYSVVARNAAGTTMGMDATFTTLSPPPAQFTAELNSQGSNNQLSLTSSPGASFTVLSSASVDLPASKWIVVGSMVESSPGLYHFTDPQRATNLLWFYRIRSP